MAAGEFDVVTYALLKGQGGGGGGGSDIETNVTNTPAGQLLSNVVIDGVRYDLNNLTPGSMIVGTVYVDIENHKSILDPEFQATFEERYGEDTSKWPTYPVYATLSCGTSDEYTWEEQGMLTVNMGDGDNKTVEFYQIAGGASYTFESDTETGEMFCSDLILPGASKVEINDWSTAPQDIVNRIKINGKNYEVESKYCYNDIQIKVSSSHRETVVLMDQVQGLIEASYGGVVPEYEIPCRFSVLIDEEHQFPPFYGWLSLRRDGDNISAVGIMNEQFDELADLEYDSDAGAFVSHHLFPIQTIVPDFAEYLEQQTGESAPVEEIHDLWLPSEKKFVKFAGGSASQYLHTVIFRKGSQDEEIVYTYYQIQYVDNQRNSNWMRTLAATIYDAVAENVEDSGITYKGYINRCTEHNATIQKIRWNDSNPVIINPQEDVVMLTNAYYSDNTMELHFNNTSLRVTSTEVVAQFTRAFDATVETDEPYWPYE